jgi:oligoendopeptidase F
VAETASVFGEMLTFRSMLNACKTPEEKKYLLAGKIEDMINTVFRQVAFHQFEVALHTKRKKGELTYDDFAKIWIDTQREALGDAVKLDTMISNFWAYISHFIHVPFYVYAYAFGDCLVNSLYSVYQKGTVDQFQDKYLNLLSQGGSKKYDELLEPFGLNPKDKTFWQGGLDVIKSLVEELESLN